MTPRLSRRGQLIVVTGTATAIVGAALASPALVWLGGLALSAVMTAYLVFFPAAVTLRRRRVEMTWRRADGGDIEAGADFEVRIAVRNWSERALRVRGLDVVLPQTLEPPDPLEVRAPPATEVEVAVSLGAKTFGYHVLHGAALRFGDDIGLFEVRAYFPSPLEVRVEPRRELSRAPPWLAAARAYPQAGAGGDPARRRGAAGDIRELREHRRGDPLKLIAWKASARRGQLIVRDHERETARSYHILVDAAGSMLAGEPGARPIDRAVDAAARTARAALSRGESVGLTIFSTRTLVSRQPAPGQAQESVVLDSLLELGRPFRDGEIDLTSAELAACVAEYLAYQEAVDVRLSRAPPPGDPAWNQVAVGPSGELYDLALMARVAGRLAEAMAASRWGRERAASHEDPAGALGDPRLRALQALCRFRGIELPPLVAPSRGERASALAAALEGALGEGRADALILISDLGCALDDPARALAPLAPAASGGRPLSVVAADAPPRRWPGAGEVEPTSVEAILRRDARERGEAARRLLSSRGAAIYELGAAPEGAISSGKSREAPRGAIRGA